MKQVASLRYGTIFKKAFSDTEIFTAFVEDVTASAFNTPIKLEIERVETEKSFSFAVGRVDARFDLFAEDNKNRVIVDIQHARHRDHYDRFLHYHCMAILEQVVNSYDYKPPLLVYTVVVLTGTDKHQEDVMITDFRPRTLSGKPVGETQHQIIYVNAKYVSEKTPEPLREWLNAILDSLDEEVDESDYERPEIHKVFNLIQKDTISPTERAKMIEEYHQEEAKRTAFEKGIKKGIEKGIEKGLREQQIKTAKTLLSMGIDVATVSEGTGLTEADVLELTNTP